MGVVPLTCQTDVRRHETSEPRGTVERDEPICRVTEAGQPSIFVIACGPSEAFANKLRLEDGEQS